MTNDPNILEAIAQLDSLRHTRNDHWQIPREEGELLHHIALSMNAQRIVEVGTSYGFSGLFWGAALARTGGRLHTIDKDPRKHESARQTFARAGLAERITAHLGDAHGVIPLIEGVIDIAFIDADKPSTQGYFELLWPKVRRGGCILTDNATTHREELSSFVDQVRSRQDARSVEVAIGNGVEWTVKV